MGEFGLMDGMAPDAKISFFDIGQLSILFFCNPLCFFYGLRSPLLMMFLVVFIQA